MNGIYHRIRAATAGTLRGFVTWRGPRSSRVRVIVAAGAATVLAIGVGVVWGLAGGGDQRPDSAGAAQPFNGVSPGEVFGERLDGLASPGPLSGGGSTTGGGLPGGAGSGSGSGNTGGGGSSGNQPPVIENAGLSSDGLTLTIDPAVTDADGDQVSLSFEIGVGSETVATRGGATAEVELDHTEVGYAPTASVLIHATDSRGATTRETFSRKLEAITTVNLEQVGFRVSRPADCFRDKAARRLTGSFLFTGPVTRTFRFDVELRVDKPSVSLFSGNGAVSGREAVQKVALVGAQFAPPVATFDNSHPHSKHPNGVPVSETVFQGTGDGDCVGTFSYNVGFFVH